MTECESRQRGGRYDKDIFSPDANQGLTQSSAGYLCAPLSGRSPSDVASRVPDASKLDPAVTPDRIGTDSGGRVERADAGTPPATSGVFGASVGVDADRNGNGSGGVEEEDGGGGVDERRESIFGEGGRDRVEEEEEDVIVVRVAGAYEEECVD